MGVSGLTDFIEKNDEERNAWRLVLIEGDLVIDANQLCYQLHSSIRFGSLDSSNGGQYPQYYQKVYKFVSNLLESGIEPHFVFEGVDKGKKLTDEYRLGKAKKQLQKQKRLKEGRGNGSMRMPPLAYNVLYNVLREMGMHTYDADGEGDEACVKIANFLRCPVLSNDSDYYLFNIPGGYINLSDLFFELQQPCVAVADIYKRKRLFTNDIFPDSEFWFLLPAIIGNGIVKGQKGVKIDDISDHILSSKVMSVDCYFEGIHDQQKRMKLKKIFEDVKQYYNPCEQNPTDLLKAPLNLRPDLPQWFVEQHRRHAIPYMLVDALVNGRQHHSKSLISLHIRQCCYSILGVREVKEYQIKGNEATIVQVKCAEIKCPLFSGVPSIPQCNREALFFSILGCTPAQLRVVEKKEKSFICSIIFWKTRTAPPCYVIKALLACFVLCSSMPNAIPAKCSPIPIAYKQSDWLKDRRLLLEWQGVYKDAIALSVLLQCDLPDICPSKIYDGNIAMFLASKLHSIDDCIPKLKISMEKYENLLQIVLSS